MLGEKQDKHVTDIHSAAFFDSDDDEEFPTELLGEDLGGNNAEQSNSGTNATSQKRATDALDMDLDEFDFVADEELDAMDAAQNEGGADKDADGAAKKKKPATKRVKMTEDLILGENGLPLLQSVLKSVKFKGKGYESDDLRRLVLAYEMWAHRLMPGLHFDDFTAQISRKGTGVVRHFISVMKEEAMPKRSEDDAYETIDDEEVAALAEAERRRREASDDEDMDAIFDSMRDSSHGTTAESARATAVPLAKAQAAPISPTLLKRMADNRQKALAAREKKRQKEQAQYREELKNKAKEDVARNAGDKEEEEEIDGDDPMLKSTDDAGEPPAVPTTSVTEPTKAPADDDKQADAKSMETLDDSKAAERADQQSNANDTAQEKTIVDTVSESVPEDAGTDEMKSEVERVVHETAGDNFTNEAMDTHTTQKTTDQNEISVESDSADTDEKQKGVCREDAGSEKARNTQSPQIAMEDAEKSAKSENPEDHEVRKGADQRSETGDVNEGTKPTEIERRSTGERECDETAESADPGASPQAETKDSTQAQTNDSTQAESNDSTQAQTNDSTQAETNDSKQAESNDSTQAEVNEGATVCTEDDGNGEGNTVNAVQCKSVDVNEDDTMTMEENDTLTLPIEATTQSDDGNVTNSNGSMEAAESLAAEKSTKNSTVSDEAAATQAESAAVDNNLEQQIESPIADLMADEGRQVVNAADCTDEDVIQPKDTENSLGKIGAAKQTPEGTAGKIDESGGADKEVVASDNDAQKPVEKESSVVD